MRLLFQNLRFQVSLIIAHVRLLETNENSIKFMIYIIYPLFKCLAEISHHYAQENRTWFISSRISYPQFHQ